MGVLEKNAISIFSRNTQNCFAYNSLTKYRSEAVLYSKRLAGYPLSHDIKTIDVSTKKLNFINLPKTPNFGCTVHTLNTPYVRFFHNIMKCKDMNCINSRFQMILCIGLEMVKAYFKLFFGKISLKMSVLYSNLQIILAFLVSQLDFQKISAKHS